MYTLIDVIGLQVRVYSQEKKFIMILHRRMTTLALCVFNNKLLSVYQIIKSLSSIVKKALHNIIVK